MAGELSTYGAKTSLDWVLGTATYLALCTTPLTDAATVATMAECVTPGYARKTVAWGAATSASPSVAANSALVTFGPVTSDMTVPVVSVALVSTASGTSGNLVAWWLLDEAMQVQNGQSLQIAVGKLTMSLT